MAETTQPGLARSPAINGDRASCPENAHATGAAAGLPTPTFLPRRYKPRNVGEWTGHLTFASELIAATQPSLIVELGTHWGEAYFTFCQTVQEQGLSSVCYAVDHWLGDEHAGRYGEEVFEEVSQYNARLYRQFSYLLRRSFDDALTQFADNSIGLLHIDGLHTYDAVKHDFHAWLPKVSPGGIVLLHDIVPRHQDFGVWRLWDEIKAELPDTFEFHHSWGLGVVRKEGDGRGTRLEQLLFESAADEREDLRRRYVVYASNLEHVLGRLPFVAEPPRLAPEVRVQMFPRVNGTYTEENSQIRKIASGAWNTVVFELRDPIISVGLRIDPGTEPSFIEVGDIAIHSVESGELLWSSPASGAEREFTVAGTAVAHPDNQSVLTNMGIDPQLVLNAPELAGPIRVTAALKITPVDGPAMNMVQQLWQAPFAEALRTLGESERENAALLRTNATLSGENAALSAELAGTQAQLQESRTAATAVEGEVRHLREVLTGVQSSASWRLTAPLRKIMSVLRGRP